MASPVPSIAPPVDRRAALDRAHVGDIEGAIGRVQSHDTAPRRTIRRRLVTLVAVAGAAVTLILALVTMLTITTVAPRVNVLDAGIVTAAGLTLCAVAVAATLGGARTPRAPAPAMTAWQRRTWSSPMLERVAPAPATRARLLMLGLLRAYTLVMIALLAARLGTLIAG